MQIFIPGPAAGPCVTAGPRVISASPQAEKITVARLVTPPQRKWTSCEARGRHTAT